MLRPVGGSGKLPPIPDWINNRLKEEHRGQPGVNSPPLPTRRLVSLWQPLCAQPQGWAAICFIQLLSSFALVREFHNLYCLLFHKVLFLSSIHCSLFTPPASIPSDWPKHFNWIWTQITLGAFRHRSVRLEPMHSQRARLLCVRQ